MNDSQCIRDFMIACGQEVADMPGLEIRDETKLLRARLVLSEAIELCWALGVRVRPKQMHRGVTTEADFDMHVAGPVDHVEAADACADLRYVVIGTELALGIPGDAVFAEVHRSNMTKLGPHGKAILDEGGKVLKPPSYVPPDVAGVLARHATGEDS